MKARYAGQCASGDWIKVDDDIEPAPIGDDLDVLVWRHIQCPEADADRDDREALAQARCSVCGLNHPGEC